MEVAFSGVFREIDPPRRLVKTERYEAVPGPGCLVTLEFDEHGAETTLTATMLFENKADRDMCLRSGMEHGVRECYANIDRLVAEM
jgi:uncharacterized protein YndB with AHSA1/START domain